MADAAIEAGVSERTVCRRLEDSGFRLELSKAWAQLVSQAIGMTSKNAASAVDTLVELLSAESETVRLGAARAILEVGTRLRESAELEERLGHPESQLELQQ